MTQYGFFMGEKRQKSGNFPEAVIQRDECCPCCYQLTLFQGVNKSGKTTITCYNPQCGFMLIGNGASVKISDYVFIV